MERRSFSLEQVATMRGRPGDAVGFKGYAALYGKRAWIGPPKYGFWEEIIRGAFSRAVEEDDVRFLVDHDPGKVLARTAAGTLRLKEDRRGLAVDADLAPTSYGTDVAVLLERGDLGEMSFAFSVDDDNADQVEWSRLKDGAELRRLVAFEKVYDVSVVAYPAYEGTEAALRAVEARRSDHRSQMLSVLRRRLEDAWNGGAHEQAR